MSDRFDFLELSDGRPAAAVAEAAASAQDSATDPLEASVGSAWKPMRLRAVEIIGDPGTAHGQFMNPLGLAVDRHGAVYVADSSNHRVQRIGMNGELKVYGRPGNAPGELWGPTAIAVDPSGDFFYVAEQGNNRVQCFQVNGQHRGVMNGFASPSGITVDVAGRLWIADTGNGRVLCWDGRHKQYLTPLDYRHGIARPISLACDPAHNLYVTEGSAEDVVYYSNYGRRSGSLGANRRLHGPQQSAIDSFGRVYLAEAGKDRLHVFTPDGSSLITFETLSTRMGSLKAPAGVALGPNGEVYVADTQNHRVVRLAWE
jgi:DNA-binding beta-propeller fold protein YncE